MYRPDGLCRPGSLAVADVEVPKGESLRVRCLLARWRWSRVEAVTAMDDQSGETNGHPGWVPENYV